MRTLPDEFTLLKKLYKLWLPFNAQKQRKVYFYYTKIFKYYHTEEDENYNKDVVLKLMETGTNLITDYPLGIKG